MSDQRQLWLIVLAFFIVVLCVEQSGDAQTQGPANGWLVIVGGGRTPNEAKERMVALAGGANANFVVIPTARADDEIDTNKLKEDFQRGFRITNVTVLHTRSRKVANSDQFVEPLKNASAVWIDGGRQWRLADAYLGTAVEREIKAVLARGGVVGGSSAGASIQASFLVRGEPGTARNPGGDNRIMMSKGHETGFGLLTNSAIDQHVVARNREGDLGPVIAAHPELLGIGIDQDAAIVVHGDSFFVVGGTVVIHNHAQGRQFQTLSSGQSFNLATRSIEPDDSVNSGFNLVLKPTSAQRRMADGSVATSGNGTLENAEGGANGTRSIQFDCSAPLYSAGGTQYPAKQENDHLLKIRTRILDGNAMREFVCHI